MNLSHHFAKFSGHRPYGSSDVVTKMFYVTLEDHVVNVSGDFMQAKSLLHILTLPKLTAIDIALAYVWLF